MENDPKIKYSARKGYSRFTKAQKYLNGKYVLKMNEIDKECYISELIKPLKFEKLSLPSLYLELTDSGNPLSQSDLEMYLNSNRVEKFHPVKEYLSKLPSWDGIDYMNKLCSYIKVDYPEEFELQLKKWFVRAVKSVFIDDYFNKHCIVLYNKIQSSGKTSFYRHLVPKELKDYYIEKMETNKDGRIQIAKNFIINLDELEVIDRKGIDTLKSLISAAEINDRLPYARKQTRIKRIANFLATTNKTEFLTDNTGNVRWIIFEVKDHINFNFLKEININDVWSQAFHLFNNTNFNAELSRDELIENEKRNARYMSRTEEEELVLEFYTHSESKNDFRNATMVKKELEAKGHYNLSHQRLGRALSGHFKKTSNSALNRYGYQIKLIK